MKYDGWRKLFTFISKSFLNKLYPDYKINEYNDIIFEKIEKICRDLFIDNTVNNIVDNIISEVILDYEKLQGISIE